jgi:hypothetical protein
MAEALCGSVHESPESMNLYIQILYVLSTPTSSRHRVHGLRLVAYLFIKRKNLQRK